MSRLFFYPALLSLLMPPAASALAAIVPIYNAYVFLQIAGKPGWWLVLLLIPIVNLVVGIIAMLSFCKNFGKGGGFAAGMIFLPIIFYPILAFGDAAYAPVAPAQA